MTLVFFVRAVSWFVPFQMNGRFLRFLSLNSFFTRTSNMMFTDLVMLNKGCLKIHSADIITFHMLCV